MEKTKRPDGTVCRSCGAVYKGGRWKRGDRPGSGNQAICPACQRTLDNYPAGTLTITGSFYGEHRREILNLVRNVEDQEISEHPLERIMDMKNEGDTLTIRTTGIHVARRIGDALHRSYRGIYDIQYEDEGMAVKISWER